MTLEPYDGDKLDQLALRIFDIGYDLRRASRAKRDDPELELAIHDKKALQWLDQLEQWAADCRVRSELGQLKRRGETAAKKIRNLT